MADFEANEAGFLEIVSREFADILETKTAAKLERMNGYLLEKFMAMMVVVKSKRKIWVLHLEGFWRSFYLVDLYHIVYI